MTPDEIDQIERNLQKWMKADRRDIATVSDVLLRQALEAIRAERERAEKAEAERDEWRAVAEKDRGTLHPLLSKLAAVQAERDRLRDDVLRALGPGTRFMDPPDGGDPTPAEQVANMRAQLDAAEAERNKLRERAEKAEAELQSAQQSFHGFCRTYKLVEAERDRLRDALERLLEWAEPIAGDNIHLEEREYELQLVAAAHAALRKTDSSPSGGTTLNTERT